MITPKKISTFLWFNDSAEDAARLYTSLFSDSKVTHVSRWGEGAPAPKGSVMQVTFELSGVQFMALNGGPHYKLNPACSIFVSCSGQSEVDELWTKLLADGGEESQCGWLVDRFGLSWQIIPTALMELMGDPDPKKSGRVVQAMLKMQKIDVAALERAHRGE